MESRRCPHFADDAETSAMLEQIDARSAHLEKLEAEVHEWEKQQAKASDTELRSRAGIIANELAAAHTGEKSCVAEVPEADAKLLQAVVDALKQKFNGPIFLAGRIEGRVSLIASVPKELTSQSSGEQIDPGSRAYRRRQRRRPAGWRARRGERCVEDWRRVGSRA